jgi:hypothetical protein
LSLIITYPLLGSLLLNSDITKTNPAYAAPTPLPITRIEERFSPTDFAGEATSGRLQIISGPMTADGGCEICQFIKYTPGPSPTAVAGVAYKATSPLDISGAMRVVFFAKGELGGENVFFVALGKPSSTSLPATGPFANLAFNVVTQKVVLTNDWKRYEISLDGTSLTGVTDLFGFVLLKGRTNVNPVVPISLRPALNDNTASNVDFFIKGVAIDGNPPATTPIPANSTASLATAPTSSLATGNTTTPLNTAQIASSPAITPSQAPTSTTLTSTAPAPTTAAPTLSNTTTAATTAAPTLSNTTTAPTTTAPTSTAPAPAPTTTAPASTAPAPAPTTTAPTLSNTTTATTSVTVPSTIQQQTSTANPFLSSNSIFGSRALLPPTLNQQQGRPLSNLGPQNLNQVPSLLAPQQSPSNSGILQNGQQPPIANAGLPQTVAENSVVTLDGRASYDPDGGSIIAYQWTQIPNNGAVPVTLLGSNTATPIFRAPVVPTDTILMFSLRVVDSDGGTISTNPTIAYVLVRHGLNTAIPNIHISPFQ